MAGNSGRGIGTALAEFLRSAAVPSALQARSARSLPHLAVCHGVGGFDAVAASICHCVLAFGRMPAPALETGVEDPMTEPIPSVARPPVPPFTRETAIQKVRMAENAWNTRDPERVSLAYTEDSRWRNRAEFPVGRTDIVAFLTRKWARELEYRLIKELWAFEENRIAVRFAYEWRDDGGNWYRSHGNENWEFNGRGLMRLRFASINDQPIREGDRKFRWPQGPRPADHPGLSDLGL